MKGKNVIMLSRIRSLLFCATLTGFGLISTTNHTGIHAAEKNAPQVQVKVLQANPLKGLHDGKPAKSSLIEVTLDPLASSPPHYHPGPVTGYVLEGTFEFQIGDRALRVLHAGDTFFEPSMILHRVSRNPDKQKRTRVLVTLIHPADAKRLTIPAKEVKPQESTRESAELEK